MAEDIEKLIRKFALANAFSHEGKAQPGAIIGKLIAVNPKYREQMKELAPKINKIVSEVNKLKLEEQEKELRKIFPEFFEKKEEKEKEKELPELPNAKVGKVVLRLAPYPSGALHIGNAKTYTLNALYAEKYKGRLLFIMDDTIGSEQKALMPESYDLIPEGFKWLGIKWNGPIIYKSDRLSIYYKYAREIIQKGQAYVCFCLSETLRKNREEGKDCLHRSQGIEETAKEFEKMLAGKYREGQATLRLRTSMQHPNPAFRDRVLMRISDRSHPRVGRKYKVWPMLEFSWAVDDHLLGVTHVFRGKELQMETDMCRHLWNIFGWPAPTVTHTGLLRIEGAKISKSKAQQEIKSGEYSGWDDPRTWSLQSLRRRGFLPEAFKEFVKYIGPNPHDIAVPIENLYAFNRKLIDPIADRYFFVPEPVEISVDDAPVLKEISCLLHPEKKKTRKIKLGKEFYISKKDFDASKGKEIRLMHLYNLRLNSKAEFTSKENKEIPKIQWVPRNFSTPAEVVMPDGSVTKGFAEKNIGKLRAGAIIQFERFGFVRLDKKEKNKIVFCYAHN